MTDWDPERDGQGRFRPGSGGRPPGARNRVARKLRETLEKSIDLHMAAALDRTSRYHPAIYVRLLLEAFPIGSDDAEAPEQADAGQVRRQGDSAA